MAPRRSDLSPDSLRSSGAGKPLRTQRVPELDSFGVSIRKREIGFGEAARLPAESCKALSPLFEKRGHCVDGFFGVAHFYDPREVLAPQKLIASSRSYHTHTCCQVLPDFLFRMHPLMTP